MSKIRAKNTKPEKLLRSMLFKLGYRFRIHPKELPGKPDIILPKYKRQFLYTDVFGTIIQNAMKEDCLQRTLNSGKKNLNAISKEIKQILKN